MPSWETLKCKIRANHNTQCLIPGSLLSLLLFFLIKSSLQRSFQQTGWQTSRPALGGLELKKTHGVEVHAASILVVAVQGTRTSALTRANQAPRPAGPIVSCLACSHELSQHHHAEKRESLRPDSRTSSTCLHMLWEQNFSQEFCLHLSLRGFPGENRS